MYDIQFGVAILDVYVEVMEVVGDLNVESFEKFRLFYTRVLSLGDGIIKRHCRFWASQSLNVVIGIGSLLSFLFAITCAYVYLFPSVEPVIESYENPNAGKSLPTPKPSSSNEKCNVFEGKWIPDESYPLYNASHCPFAESGFNCFRNGRRDKGYTKWRWKPKNCEIPRFNAREVLEKLRWKRVVFVGDSLSRTQWESFICMLMTGVDDKRSVYEVNGNKITKRIRFLGVQFSTYNLRVDFYRSVFLVQPSSVPRRAPKRVKSTLRLDMLDDMSREWFDSDVLIFNSGHWWTPTKLFEM